MLLHQHQFILTAAVLAVIGACSAATPDVSTPEQQEVGPARFLQLTPHRWTFAGHAYAGWNQVPFLGNITQVIDLPGDGRGSGIVVVNETKAFTYHLGPDLDQPVRWGKLHFQLPGALQLHALDSGILACQLMRDRVTAALFFCYIDRGSFDDAAASCSLLAELPLVPRTLTATGVPGRRGQLLVLLGTDTGLWVLPCRRARFAKMTCQISLMHRFAGIADGSVELIAAQAFGSQQRYVAVAERLAGRPERRVWVLEVATKLTGNFVWCQSVLGDTPTAMAWNATSEDLWLATTTSLHRRDSTTKAWERWDGINRLVPLPNITSIASAADGSIWFGSNVTHNGLARLDSSWTWRFMQGPRWLSGQRVLGLVRVGQRSSVLAATDAGVTRMSWRTASLAAKAASFDRVVQARHNRYGLVAACRLKQPGDVEAGCVRMAAASDNLWTCQYVMALAYKWTVTSDPAVRLLAWQHVLAQLALLNVTGIPGYPARSLCHVDDAGCSGRGWHRSTTPGMEQFVWLGDTSSDSLSGFMTTMILAHDLLLPGDSYPEDKLLVRNAFLSVVRHIVQHDFYLVGETGKPTRWGVWNPRELYLPEWADERGLNALQIQAWLVAACRLEGHPGNRYFEDALVRLSQQHDYISLLRDIKVTYPGDVNWGDDELMQLAMLVMLGKPYRTTVTGPVIDATRVAYTNAYNGYIRRGGLALSNFLYYTLVYEGRDDFASSIAWLARFPDETIDWPVRNSHRLDLRVSPDVSRGGRRTSVVPIPPDEAGMPYRWNSDVMDLDRPELSARTEYEPNQWLAAYWLGVAQRILPHPAASLAAVS